MISPYHTKEGCFEAKSIPAENAEDDRDEDENQRDPQAVDSATGIIVQNFEP